MVNNEKQGFEISQPPDLESGLLSDLNPLNAPRKDMTDVTKVCRVCGRERPAKKYLYSQTEDDHLEARCRTCRSWKPRTPPTKAQVTEYERELRLIMQEGIASLKNSYGDQPAEDLASRYRGEFSQFVMIAHDRAGLTKSWRYPIWAHPSSSPDFALTNHKKQTTIPDQSTAVTEEEK